MPDDDFFLIGGHSLEVTRLRRELHKLVPVEIPLRDLFRHTTARAIARHVARTDLREEAPDAK